MLPRHLIIALAVVAMIGACLLPDYQNVGPASSTETTAVSTGGGGTGATGGEAGAAACPNGPFTARIGTDEGQVLAATPSGYARIANDGAGVTSVMMGQFTEKLLYKSGVAALTVTMPPHDGFVVGLDDSGAGQWAVQVAGDDAENMVAIAAASDGAVIVGSSPSPFAVGPHASEPYANCADAFVAKIDRQGTVVWMDQLVSAHNMGNIVTPLGLAVDPANDDIFVVGVTSGFTVTRKPDPTPDMLHDCTETDPNDCPFYLHLAADGSVDRALVWPSVSGSVAHGVVVTEAHHKYVLGDYVGAFPSVMVTQPPGTSGGIDAFLLELDAADVPIHAVAYGSDTRDDRLERAALLDGGDLVVVVTSEPDATPEQAFELGGEVIQGTAVTPGLNIFVARVDPSGDTAKWLKHITLMNNVPEWVDVRTHMGSRPVVSLGLPPGSTIVDGVSFTASDDDSLIVELNPMTGIPMAKIRIEGPDFQQAYLVPSPCGDTIAGTFRGRGDIAGLHPYDVAQYNVFAAFSPTSPFTAWP